MWGSLASWMVNALIMAIIAAKADEKRGYQIEEHPLLAFFLVFIIPTIIELISHYLAKEPFFFWLLGI